MELDDAEVRELCLACDEENDGIIGYEEFVRQLASHDIDPDFDAMALSRERELKMLKRIARRRVPRPNDRLRLVPPGGATPSATHRSRAPWEGPNDAAQEVSLGAAMSKGR